MNVCVICDSFPPTAGGSETHTSSVAKYLRERGHLVSVVALRPGKDALIRNGYDETMIKALSREKMFLDELGDIPIYNIVASRGIRHSLLAVRKRIRELARAKPINVFDVHQVFLLTVVALMRGRVIFSDHLYDLCCPLGGFPSKFMPDYFTLEPSNQFFSYRKCVIKKRCVDSVGYLKWRAARLYATYRIDTVIVKTMDRYRIFLKTGWSPEKIALVPYWINADHINDECRKNRDSMRKILPWLAPSDIVVGFIGRLDDCKNPILLLKAFKILDEKLSNVKLMYVGHGPLRGELEKLTVAYGLQSKVFITGKVIHEDIARYLSILDIVAHTQRYSNYGWALLETMAAAKPIVATDAGRETREILRDGYNALLVRPDPESLASGLTKLIENPSLAKTIGENAFKSVKVRHGYENIEKYERIMLDLLAKHPLS